MKADIFDEIGRYVPASHTESYWRMAARLRHLGPEDEILNIVLAMRILTFLLRDLPAELIEEKKAWKTQVDNCRAELTKTMQDATRQAVRINNQTEVMAIVGYFLSGIFLSA